MTNVLLAPSGDLYMEQYDVLRIGNEVHMRTNVMLASTQCNHSDLQLVPTDATTGCLVTQFRWSITCSDTTNRFFNSAV
jgi:hypothetical protein